MKLSEAEKYIMSVIWDADKDINLNDLAIMLKNRYNKEWQLQTIATFLKRIEKKGAIRIEKKGRYSYYYPLISKEEYAAIELKEIATILFKDDMYSLMSFASNLLK